MLRRKGRLKEQDALIDWIIRLHATDGPETVFAKVERWVDEHRARPHGSTLSMHVPVLGSFLTPLPLADALAEYDQFSGLSRRRYVPPNFAEVRHVLNIAQVHALAKLTRGEGESLPLLVTFDADGTLYEDGKHFEADNKMISLLVSLMRRGVQVAIVTAAGYPEAERFEARIRALLAAFEELQLPKETTDRFHMMGGECNYLLAVTDDYRLEFVPNERWQTEEMIGWDESAVEALLDTAQASLESHAARLSMDVDLIRKSRAVGVVPVRPTLYEALEELALSTRYDLESAELDLPFCAFNGGNDVFCDGAMRSPQRGAAVVAWAGRLALTRRLRRARPNAPSPPRPRARLRSWQQGHRPASTAGVPGCGRGAHAARRRQVHAHGERHAGAGILFDPVGGQPRRDGFLHQDAAAGPQGHRWRQRQRRQWRGGRQGAGRVRASESRRARGVRARPRDWLVMLGNLYMVHRRCVWDACACAPQP